jgi:predicted Holliday junction resolvase-like endonuclease
LKLTVTGKSRKKERNIQQKGKSISTEKKNIANASQRKKPSTKEIRKRKEAEKKSLNAVRGKPGQCIIPYLRTRNSDISLYCKF